MKELEFISHIWTFIDTHHWMITSVAVPILLSVRLERNQERRKSTAAKTMDSQENDLK